MLPPTAAPPRTDIVIWGAAGHALVVADILRQQDHHRIVGFLDDVNPDRHGKAFGGGHILGGREQLEPLRRAGVHAVVVAIGNGAARLRLGEVARAHGFHLASAVHPRAVVARDVALGVGTVVCAGAVVNPAAAIGESVILNTAATVDHECVIEDGVHVGPGVHLGGRVRIDRGAWMGIGAIARDGVHIGAGAIVGAGSVVVSDVAAHTVVYGVPARLRRAIDPE